MSKAADLATLELIAAIHQATTVEHDTYQLLVHRLHQQVSHFEWVGLYQWSDHAYVLKASAGNQTLDSLARKAILQVPIKNTVGEQSGRITVISKAIAFDESDFTSLKTLALELGRKKANEQRENL